MSSIESHLSNKLKQVFFNPINIFDTFTHSITLLYIFKYTFFILTSIFLIYSINAKNILQTNECKRKKRSSDTLLENTQHASPQNHWAHGFYLPLVQIRCLVVWNDWIVTQNGHEWINFYYITWQPDTNYNRNWRRFFIFNTFNGKYSAVIIVGTVFISPFLFYCLLLNHSFPTNPNRITNCF